jgi:hypothetical protein
MTGQQQQTGNGKKTSKLARRCSGPIFALQSEMTLGGESYAQQT